MSASAFTIPIYISLQGPTIAIKSPSINYSSGQSKTDLT